MSDYGLHLLQPARHLVSRWFALIWLGVIVVVSLYPFSGWEWSGEPLLDFLTYPLPYYQRDFDNVVNVLAYLPYGFALARMSRRRWLGFLFACVAASATSFAVELTQNFLPNRVSSNLDLICNALGGAIGATIATVPLCRRIGAWLLARRYRWFVPDSTADYALMLLAVWFLTQINPAVPLFGVVVMPRGLPQPFLSPLTDPVLFLMLLEAGGAMLHLTATLLFITAFLSRRRYQLRAVLLFLAAAWLVKMLAAGMLLKPMAFFEWMNHNVALGLVSGLLAAWLCTRLPRGGQLLLALFALAGSVWLTELWPLAEAGDSGEELALFRWNEGHLRNLNALADFASRWWPWAAIGCLSLALWRILWSRFRPPRPDPIG